MNRESRDELNWQYSKPFDKICERRRQMERTYGRFGPIRRFRDRVSNSGVPIIEDASVVGGALVGAEGIIRNSQPEFIIGLIVVASVLGIKVARSAMHRLRVRQNNRKRGRQ